MSLPKQRPSPEELVAIAQAGEEFASALANAIPFWDQKPEENPITILVKRRVTEQVQRMDTESLERALAWSEENRLGRSIEEILSHAAHLEEQYADSDWDNEYFEELFEGAKLMASLGQQLHQLLAEVWPKYLGTLENPDSLTRSEEERERMPETAVEGWPSGVVRTLRGLQRDLASVERGFAEAIRADIVPTPEKFSIALVESIRSHSKELIRTVGNSSQTSIPPEERTKPMSYRRAAELMGKGKSKDAAEWLSASVRDGSIPCEHVSRQTHIFSRLNFPRDVWPQILPRSPQNPD